MPAELLKRSAPVKLKPRGEYVLIRVVKRGTARGGKIHVPDQAAEGMDFFVEDVGPEVDGDLSSHERLKPGDRVQITGSPEASYFTVPGTQDLILTEQKYVVAVYEDE